MYHPFNKVWKKTQVITLKLEEFGCNIQEATNTWDTKAQASH